MENSKAFKQPHKQRFTGNQLVLLNPDQKDSARSFATHARKIFGANVHSAHGETGSPMNVKEILKKPGAVVLPTLGVAIVNAPSKTMNTLMAGSAKNVIAATSYSEPERYVYAIQDVTEVKNYLRGFRDASDAILKKMELDANAEYSISESMEATRRRKKFYNDTNLLTWGLQATGVNKSPYTGQGVKLAILDTGIFARHADFAGRNMTSKSFVNGETIDDMQGHGTHTAGTAAGNINQQTGRRYGIAHNCDLYIGKVLNNNGEGTDGMVLAGIEWAINSGCRIISMSLGSIVEEGEAYSRVYERVAQRALSMNTIIIAAAGNESARPHTISPVGSPANCPSILAVAAVDNHYRVADFSCGQRNEDGGQVDIAGPGVAVYSSTISPDLYATWDGTSMATPHVSGIAALYAEKFPNATAHELWMLLTTNAKRLTLSSTDVGSGLVQAPN